MKKENKINEIRIEKVTLSIGSGINEANNKKAITLLSTISGKKPVQSYAKKRIAQWKLRPGLPIGAKVTLRKDKALEVLGNLLKAVDNKIKRSKFTESGFSFGVPEYIDIPGVKYDPKIGIMGLAVMVTLERIGFRIKRRKIEKKKLPKAVRITAEDAIKFATEQLGVIIE